MMSFVGEKKNKQRKQGIASAAFNYVFFVSWTLKRPVEGEKTIKMKLNT